MNRTDAPVKQSTPFAVNGQREPILPTTPAGDNTASYADGFPPITMILKSAGGLPPKGQDMNQILFELSALARWASSGATNAWDAAFSTAIGGYPMGAVVLGTDGTTQYKNTVDSNTTNPNTSGAGWFNVTTGYLKTASNLSEIAAAGSAAVAEALANLGLKTAAQRDVGTGTNQIPDMSAFPFSVNIKNGWTKLPNGLIIQFYAWNLNSGSNTLTFPTAFPAEMLVDVSMAGTPGVTITGASATRTSRIYDATGATVGSFIAIGR
ncbi:hypothetical protein D8682_01585 [Buttiauxella sp. 3AFRM03]|uniref:gp53-like domain-containing protein n=1 Tax=Buttiauxella sp. 3AFRM03 TaxID=2479367 RepID=UPI000EF805DC|nr:hypothetical protein [Buttiauxella sp. 3AFRM03]AYN25786.1 hypothetical protein D8682_01585 [Buttiauxella sp. 3AFRM03]